MNDQILMPGQDEHAKALNYMLNADAMWKAALRDSKDGKRLINNAGTLRHEDHRKIMDAVVKIRRRSLNGIADLMAAGLTSPEDIGTMLVGVESINEFQAAGRSMNPTARQNNDTTFVDVYTPMPITHQGWSIPWRQNGFSYKRTLGMEESVRQVSESLENMLFLGASDIVVNVSGTNSSIIGYTTAPNRETFSVSDWSDITTNGAKIIPETLEMVALAFTEGSVSRQDSLMMYVANDFWNALENDYSTSKGDRTFIERIKAIPEIRDVKPAEKLTSKNVIMVEMDKRTVEMPMASDIVTVPLLHRGGMEPQEFMTYAVMVPILKSDRNDTTGIVHGS